MQTHTNINKNSKEFKTLIRWATRYFTVVSIFSVTVKPIWWNKGTSNQKDWAWSPCIATRPGIQLLGTRNDFLWKTNILHTKQLETFSWQNILMENFAPTRTYFWCCGVAKIRTALFSEISIPVIGVAKGFTSSFGAWTACGNGNISLQLPCLSLRIFSGSAEGDATWPIQVFPSSYDCWMYTAVKLNLTNMYNRFCLWGTASAKRWLGLNTPVVTEFIWRSVSVPHTTPDITPSALSIQRHHALMNKEQTYLCGRLTRNYTSKECDKTLPPCATVEILFAMVSFAMYTTLALHGVMKCKAQHPSRDWPSLKDHCKMIKKDQSLKITGPFLQRHRQ